MNQMHFKPIHLNLLYTPTFLSLNPLMNTRPKKAFPLLAFNSKAFPKPNE